MLLLLGATLVGNNNCINEKIRGEALFCIMNSNLCSIS